MSDADVFRNDFFSLLKAAANAKRGYRDEFMSLRAAELLKAFVADFSRKYAFLTAKVSRDEHRVPRLHVLIERSSEVFDVLETIISVSKVTRKGEHISWSEFKSRPAVNSSVVFSYQHRDALHELQLLYHPDGFEVALEGSDEYSAEYRLCLHYALKKVDRAIDLSRYALMSGPVDSSPGDTRGTDTVEF